MQRKSQDFSPNFSTSNQSVSTKDSPVDIVPTAGGTPVSDKVDAKATAPGMPGQKGLDEIKRNMHRRSQDFIPFEEMQQNANAQIDICVVKGSVDTKEDMFFDCEGSDRKLETAGFLTKHDSSGKYQTKGRSFQKSIEIVDRSRDIMLNTEVDKIGELAENMSSVQIKNSNEVKSAHTTCVTENNKTVTDFMKTCFGKANHTIKSEDAGDNNVAENAQLLSVHDKVGSPSSDIKESNVLKKDNIQVANEDLFKSENTPENTNEVFVQDKGGHTGRNIKDCNILKMDNIQVAKEDDGIKSGSSADNKAAENAKEVTVYDKIGQQENTEESDILKVGNIQIVKEDYGITIENLVESTTKCYSENHKDVAEETMDEYTFQENEILLKPEKYLFSAANKALNDRTVDIDTTYVATEHTKLNTAAKENEDIIVSTQLPKKSFTTEKENVAATTQKPRLNSKKIGDNKNTGYPHSYLTGITQEQFLEICAKKSGSLVQQTSKQDSFFLSTTKHAGNTASKEMNQSATYKKYYSAMTNVIGGKGLAEEKYEKNIDAKPDHTNLEVSTNDTVKYAKEEYCKDAKGVNNKDTEGYKDTNIKAAFNENIETKRDAFKENKKGIFKDTKGDTVKETNENAIKQTIGGNDKETMKKTNGDFPEEPKGEVIMQAKRDVKCNKGDVADAVNETTGNNFTDPKSKSIKDSDGDTVNETIKYYTKDTAKEDPVKMTKKVNAKEPKRDDMKESNGDALNWIKGDKIVQANRDTIKDAANDTQGDDHGNNVNTVNKLKVDTIVQRPERYLGRDEKVLAGMRRQSAIWNYKDFEEKQAPYEKLMQGIQAKNKSELAEILSIREDKTLPDKKPSAKSLVLRLIHMLSMENSQMNVEAILTLTDLLKIVKND